MNRQQCNVYLCGILTTLADMGANVPKSPIYLAMGMNANDYETIERIMTTAGLVTVTAETMTLTKKGEEMVGKIRAVVPGV
jgi:predicted transcriptional regulator